MQHFSVRERFGVAAAAGIVLMLGLGGWAYSRAEGDASPNPAFAPVGANGVSAAVEIAAGGSTAPKAASVKSAAVVTGTSPVSAALLVVHVTGEVRNPGVYKFRDGDRIADAIHAAGGFKDHADQEALNLADTLRDADQICVPLLVKISGPELTKEERIAGDYAEPAPVRRRHSPIVHGAPVVTAPSVAETAAPPADAPADSPLPAAVAVALPVAPRQPGRVLGRPVPQYSAVDETADESAGTESEVAAAPQMPTDMPILLKTGKRARSAGVRTMKSGKSAGKSGKFKNPGDGIVHINSANAAQLEQLPGVGPAMSGRIVEYRAQIGKFTDVTQLTDVKGIGAKKYEKMAPFLAL